ncbi:MAG: hypothetical protein QM652_10230 [Legionella sp.]|uniref:hypothetical protein n=1 Tax=Legionella sp. TaxID=459 RepID=UPI0039E588AE
MPESLIKIILSQANKIGAKPEDMPELNKRLQENVSSGIWSAKNYMGGLGREYQDLKPYLSIESKVIKEIKHIEKIQAVVEDYITNGHNSSKEQSYRIAIWAALIAVYASVPQVRFKAYK